MEDSIPSLNELFISDSTTIEDDTSTKVDEDSDEELDVEQADRDLRFIFENKLRDNAKMRSHCHPKVEVLLIDWKKNSEAFLDTNNEVNRLKRVFKKKYNFKVRRNRLNTEAKQPVEMQMEKFLTDFKYDYDSDDSLFIIYYAGHGLPDKADSRTLHLHPTTTRPESYKTDMNHIVWNKAEERIKDTKADILLIFDCCYAGVLATGEKRSPRMGKIFDFLGASQANQKAWAPGPNSFTSALIWALNQCVTRTDGFTLHELESQIKLAPSFQEFPDPKHQQVPCIGERGIEPAIQRLRLCALCATEDATQQHRDKLAQHQPGQPKFYLALEFCFSSCPTTKNIEFLGKQMRDIVNEEKYPLQQVLWRGLSPQQKWRNKMKDGVNQILLRLRNGTIPSPITQGERPSAMSLPAIIVKSPLDITQESQCGATDSLTIYKASAFPPEVQCSIGKQAMPGHKQNYFYATILIERRSWVLCLMGMCCVFLLGYLLSETHPHLYLSWLEKINVLWSRLKD